MAYSTNPNLPKARALALKLLLEEALPTQVVASRCGVDRSTIYRWKRKWEKLNVNVQLENFNRPTRDSGTKFRQAALRWLIPTLSSKPRVSPRAISDSIVCRVMELRKKLKRCAEVVWYTLTKQDGIKISLKSS